MSVKNRISIEPLHPYIPGRPIEDVKNQYSLSEVVKLASNESPYGPCEAAKKAFSDSLDEVFLYPDGACTRLRTALAKKLNLDANELVFGCGADELIKMIALAYIETGDEMITSENTFGQYYASVAAMGGNTVLIPTVKHTYDLNGILSVINERTKLIFIANPNNPTGSIVTDSDKLTFLDAVPKNIMVVFDEAYEEFVNNPSYSSSVPLVKKYDNLIVLKTFSKIYGLAALRVGYGAANEEIVNCLEKIRSPFNVSTPAQNAALASLGDSSFVDDIKMKNNEVKLFCYKALSDLGFDFIKSEANFIMVNVYRDSGEVFEALMKNGYIVRPGSLFGMNSYIRVTLGTMEQMQGFFEALKLVKSE